MVLPRPLCELWDQGSSSHRGIGEMAPALFEITSVANCLDLLYEPPLLHNTREMMNGNNFSASPSHALP